MRDVFGERLSIEAEMARERASAMKRVMQGLEHYLKELQSLEADHAKANAEDRARIQTRHDEVRELAKRQLWYAIVQREAMGLNNHEVLYEVYRIPGSLTL